MKWRASRRSRLIDALRERVSSSISARSLKRALESNACRVNGRIERFASVQLEKGDWIELASLETGVKEMVSYPVLYEDEELFVLNKPVGAVCTDAAFQQTLGRRVYLAHRLDKDTTGVLLFGKSQAVAKELQELFEKREMDKEYLAIVDGVPTVRSGEIKSRFVKKGNFEGQTIWGSNPAGVGLYAETGWELGSSLGNHAALLRCFPRTGRTHQIRVHLAEMGHPILIDRQYASRFRSAIVASRPLLHASRLQLTWRGKLLVFTAELPKEFKIILSADMGNLFD